MFLRDRRISGSILQSRGGLMPVDWQSQTKTKDATMKVKPTIAAVAAACAGLVFVAHAQSRLNETSDQTTVTTAAPGALNPTMIQAPSQTNSPGTNRPGGTNMPPHTNMPPGGTNLPPIKTNLPPAAANVPQPAANAAVR
jgi:hypothetical protein